MKNNHPKILHQALYRILRRLAKMLLRNGIPFGEFVELVRRAYVASALEDFCDDKGKTTDSRAAVMTGLTRKEVKHQREILSDSPEKVSINNVNRASRVVSGWVQDPRFRPEGNEVASLALDGENSFSLLVKEYSGDMTPKAVLEELLRVGMVSLHKSELANMDESKESTVVVLNNRSYVPAGDSEEMIQIFGEDVADLITTIDHNLECAQKAQPFYQCTLSYDNIPPEVMLKWRKMAADQSQQLLEQLDGWLSQHDRDRAAGSAQHQPSVSNQSLDQERFRTGVGIFYFEESLPPKKDQH